MSNSNNPAKLIKDALRPAYWFALDTIDRLTGRHDALTPPRRLIFVGDGSFTTVGREFFKYFIDLCGLEPHAHVLDVGCGIGRMAVPLTSYLASGTYEGFDIVPKGIHWCNKKITRRYPNFRFQIADIYNKVYNPSGSQQATEYVFPYPNESFDFTFLTSVFTHMLPLDIEHYISEIVRVLKPNGKALITHFLITQESRDLIDRGLSTFHFRDSRKGYWSRSEEDPEQAVGYDERFLVDLYKRHGMSIIQPIHYGSWCGRKQYLSFQDILIAQKSSGQMSGGA